MSALGRYRAIKQLAAGGMGEVFLAEDSAPSQGAPSVVAIKRVAAAVASAPERLELFRHEAHLLTSLAHRHIVRVYEVGEDDQGCFVAMELVEGPSLRHLLERLAERGRHLPPALALEIAAQVGDALAFAYYARGPDGAPLRIIHRDVSPRNILVSHAGEAKLIDFGIAQSLRQPPGPGPGVIGKVGYLSPEQLAGEPLNARSDLFSLGIVVCEMLSGRHPFERGSAEELAQAIRCGAPLLPSASAPELAICDAVLLRLLAKRPSDRFFDGLEAAKELGNLRAQVPKSTERLGELVRDLFDVQLQLELESPGDGQGAAPPNAPGTPPSPDSSAPLRAPVPVSRSRTLRLFPLEGHALPETVTDPQFPWVAPGGPSRGPSSTAAPEAAVHIFVPGQALEGSELPLDARPAEPLAVGASDAASEAAEPTAAQSARMIPVQFFRPSPKSPPEPTSPMQTEPSAESGTSAAASNPSAGPAGRTPPAAIRRFPTPAPGPKAQPKASGVATSPPKVESLALAAQQAQELGLLAPKGAAIATEPAPGPKGEPLAQSESSAEPAALSGAPEPVPAPDRRVPPLSPGAERAHSSAAHHSEFPQVAGSATAGPALAPHALASAPPAQTAAPGDLFGPTFFSVLKPIGPSAAPAVEAREEATGERAPDLATGPSAPAAVAPAESDQPGTSAALAPTSAAEQPETLSALSARPLLEGASPLDAEEPAERAAPPDAELVAARGRAHRAEAPEPASKADSAAGTPALGAPPATWPVPSEPDAEAASAQGRAPASPRPRSRRGALLAALALAAIAGVAVVSTLALRRQGSRPRPVPSAAENSARAPEPSPAKPLELPAPVPREVQGAALSAAAASPEPAPLSAPNDAQLRPTAPRAAASELFRRASTRAKPVEGYRPPTHRPAGNREEHSDPLRPQIQAPVAEGRRPEAHKPAFRLSLLSPGSSVRRTLSGSAQIQVLEAEGVAVSLSYRVEDSALQATLTSEPWTIVAVDGLSVGRTPVPLPDLLHRPVRLELRRPGAAPVSFELYARPEP